MTESSQQPQESSRSVPRYRQLKEKIVAQIASGELQPHDRVPSENEWVQQAGVSRMTANRALKELTGEGYLRRVTGVGTFVADVNDIHAASHVLEVRNIADEIVRRGHRHSMSVLKKCRVKAEGELAQALDVSNGDTLFRVLLCHYENGVPIQLEDRHVLPAFAPEFLKQSFSDITPSAYLSRITPLQEAKHVVRAAIPDTFTRDALEMAPDEACLVVLRRTWADGRAVTHAELVHPGSRFELSGHFVPLGSEAGKQL